MPCQTTSQADRLMQKWLWRCNAHLIEAIPTGQTQGGTVRPLPPGINKQRAVLRKEQPSNNRKEL